MKYHVIKSDGRSYDGRDYDKPMYLREDGKVVIYHNEFESGTDYEFAIATEDGDGSCESTLFKAIDSANEMVSSNDSL